MEPLAVSCPVSTASHTYGERQNMSVPSRSFVLFVRCVHRRSVSGVRGVDTIGVNTSERMKTLEIQSVHLDAERQMNGKPLCVQKRSPRGVRTPGLWTLARTANERMNGGRVHPSLAAAKRS